MRPALVGPPFEMIEAEVGLEFAVLLFDGPATARERHEVDQRRAKHSGMPQSATQTGCGNRVLSPRELADRICAVVAAQDAGAPSLLSPPSEPQEQLIARLWQHTTLDFSDYRRSTITSTARAVGA